MRNPTLSHNHTDKLVMKVQGSNQRVLLGLSGLNK